ncbi:gluconokinase [Parafrankia sp. FMc6]|uniref:gluconokinase n=1 Tax=Parafrankia soli TaxID=2599596 RepID=UPI0034D6A87B
MRRPSPAAASGTGVDVILGVDVGTTATKVVAFDPDGREHASARVGYPLLEPHPGEAVQDPDVIRGAVTEAIRGAARQAGNAGHRVSGLSFSAAMHTLIGLGGTGRPLTPSLTWADARAAAQAERLRATHGLELHRRTGTPTHPMSPLAKLVWFREQDPETFAAVRRWVGIKEYILADLCGEWLVDHSVASATGLLDLAALDWDGEALDVAGIDPARLSRLAATTEVLPRLTPAAAEALGLPAATPVVVGASDGALASLGVGAVHGGAASCSIGTSAAIRVMVDRPTVDPSGHLFCYALTPGRWAVGGAINNGGLVLRWARDALAPDLGDEAAVLDIAARAPAGSDGLLMLPYLTGERAPHWDSLSRGAYVGLTRGHRREHLVRAALEGVCLQLALVAESIRAAGIEVREMRATGGFARSALWRQILTDALGMDVDFPAVREGTSFGAALLGMYALGMVENLDVAADLVQAGESHHPEPASAATYRVLLPVFDSLHEALVPAFRTLRDLGRPGHDTH